MSVAKRRSRSQLTTFSIRGFAFNPLLTHMGAVRCNMLTGALVPRWGTVAGVPGPRRSADERDAGWFAPVATRRRPYKWSPGYSLKPIVVRFGYSARRDSMLPMADRN